MLETEVGEEREEKLVRGRGGGERREVCEDRRGDVGQKRGAKFVDGGGEEGGGNVEGESLVGGPARLGEVAEE